jgi:hypothetical protein
MRLDSSHTFHLSSLSFSLLDTRLMHSYLDIRHRVPFPMMQASHLKLETS